MQNVNGVRHHQNVECPECGRVFLDRGLARHRRTHGVQPVKAKKVSQADKLRAFYRKELGLEG